jgi:hypothetical protein
MSDLDYTANSSHDTNLRTPTGWYLCKECQSRQHSYLSYFDLQPTGLILHFQVKSIPTCIENHQHFIFYLFKEWQHNQRTVFIMIFV